MRSTMGAEDIKIPVCAQNSNLPTENYFTKCEDQ
jgi:hypothetical protein